MARHARRRPTNQLDGAAAAPAAGASECTSGTSRFADGTVRSAAIVTTASGSSGCVSGDGGRCASGAGVARAKWSASGFVEDIGACSQ